MVVNVTQQKCSNNKCLHLSFRYVCVCVCVWGGEGDENGGTQGPKSKSWALDVSPL